MSFVENYRKLKEEICEAAYLCKRKPEDIQLVAVSKGVLWENIVSIYNKGCRDFGENRLQEALPKMQKSYRDCRWHFIGTLQKNKVRKAVGQFVLIHSVDSLELAKKISEISVENSCKTAILLQVNTSGEQSKHGMTTEECLRDFSTLMVLPGLEIQGLMTMAPFVEDERIIRDTFKSLRLLRDKIVDEYHLLNGLPHLSMGMSHDFKCAIAEGATMLRIGNRIWG